MLISDEYAHQLARLLIDGKLVLFVGAGISLQARSKATSGQKLPLWDELARRVAEITHENITSYGGDLLDLFDAVARKADRRTLEDAIRDSIQEDKFEPGPVHDLISDLPWARVYTTNYDNLLDRAFGEKSPIVSEQDYELLTRPANKQPRIVHLHGTLWNMHTLTGEDYERWSENHPKAHNRFVVDGTENTILFLGYSNSDPHFKKLILPQIKYLKTSRGHNNHSWMWRPSKDQRSLFLQRDKIEIHPIEVDNEWYACLDKLRESLLDISNAHAGKAKRKIEATVPVGRMQDELVRINGYKLFYYRDFRSISRDNLANRTGISSRRITSLETVNKNMELGPKCFRFCKIGELHSLENILTPDTSFEYGAKDDILAYYIEYYKNNWKKPRAKSITGQDNMTLPGRTRAVVFDFGGTLTIPQFKESTWERIWKSVGFSLEESNELHHLFSAGKISHQQWCDMTCEKLRSKGFSLSSFESVYADIRAIDGLRETFEILRGKSIAIHIVSGSLRTIIEKVLDGAARYVDSIRSNDMVFDKEGKLINIIGHPYDFEGKAKFINLLAKELACYPIDILFVGNSLNDEDAATSGARTLCVNPKHTHYYVQSMWNNVIREMTNLSQILRYV